MYLTRMRLHSTIRRLATSGIGGWLARRPRLVLTLLVLLLLVASQGAAAAEGGSVVGGDDTMDYLENGTSDKGP